MASRRISARWAGCLLAVPLMAGAGSGQEQDSVFSWGRWTTLAPAAGPMPALTAAPAMRQVDFRPGDAAAFTPALAEVESPAPDTGPPAQVPPVIEEPLPLPGAGPADPALPVSETAPNPPAPPTLPEETLVVTLPGVGGPDPSLPVSGTAPSPPPPPAQ